MIPPPMMTARAWLGTLTSPRSGPGQRVGLQVGEALHRLEHALLVAQPGVLDPSERRALEAIARHLADVDRTDLEPVHEARDPVEAIRADGRREPVRGRVGDADGLLDVAEADDRRHRAEGLARHELAVGGHAVHHGGAVEGAAALVTGE